MSRPIYATMTGAKWQPAKTSFCLKIINKTFKKISYRLANGYKNKIGIFSKSDGTGTDMMATSIEGMVTTCDIKSNWT